MSPEKKKEEKNDGSLGFGFMGRLCCDTERRGKLSFIYLFIFKIVKMINQQREMKRG